MADTFNTPAAKASPSPVYQSTESMIANPREVLAGTPADGLRAGAIVDVLHDPSRLVLEMNRIVESVAKEPSGGERVAYTRHHAIHPHSHQRYAQPLRTPLPPPTRGPSAATFRGNPLDYVRALFPGRQSPERKRQKRNFPIHSAPPSPTAAVPKTRPEPQARIAGQPSTEPQPQAVVQPLIEPVNTDQLPPVSTQPRPRNTRDSSNANPDDTPPTQSKRSRRKTKKQEKAAESGVVQYQEHQDIMGDLTKLQEIQSTKRS